MRAADAGDRQSVATETGQQLPRLPIGTLPAFSRPL